MFLKNINNLNSIVNISEDLDNKELLINLNSKINNNELINSKYYITNSTGYLYLKQFSNNYINVGSNNYFENINDKNINNYDYLINKIIEYIPKNISDSSISQEKESTTMDDKQVKLLKTTYIIDNKELIDLINKVKNDLKKDSKSKEIISNINKKFLDKEISNEEEILDDDTYIKYSIYTDVFYRAKKLEIEVEEKSKSSSISYEVLKDSTLIKVIDEGKIIIKYYIKKINNKYVVEIKDSSNKKIGKIEFENADDRTSFNYQSLDDIYKTDITFVRNLTNIKKNKSYKSNMLLSINVTDVKTAEKYLILDLNLDSDVSNKCNISEDVSKALIKSSFSEEENNKLNNVIINIINKLFGGDLLEKS